ncbi:MAG TPA: alpha-E domain-containing protein, partial [Pseudoxanthomonas sp.]
MLSRVADNLYWFSRYVRRAENTARLVGVGSQLQLDMPRSVRFAWRPMIDTVGAGECFEQCYPTTAEAAGDADVIRFLLLDERNPSSLRTSVDSAREILRSIRDTLPQDVWEAINDLHLYIAAQGERSLSRRYRLEFLQRIVDGCLKVSGLLSANVSRDIGYQFMRLGTGLEQADMTTRIMDAGASG